MAAGERSVRFCATFTYAPHIRPRLSIRAGVLVTCLLSGGVASFACHVEDASLDGHPCACVDSGQYICVAGQCVENNGSCAQPFPLSADPRVSLPFFPAATAQTVDGYGLEFCNLPAYFFDLADGAAPTPSPPWPAGVDSTAVVVVAWNADGLHLYAEITQPVFAPNVNSPDRGDAFELYSAGFPADGGLYGELGEDLGATHIIVIPAGDAGLAFYYVGTDQMMMTGPPRTEFATRRLDGGYAVEMMIPANGLSGGTLPLVAGQQVSFDFALDRSGNPDGGRYQSLLALVPRPATPGDAAAAPGCTGAALDYPYCDDRSWCTPVLAADGDD